MTFDFYKGKYRMRKYGDICKMTPLHVAAIDGNIELCRLLVNNIHDVNPKDGNGHIPLYYAATNGHLEVFRIIMERAKDKNPSETSGWTPFHQAAKYFNLDILQNIKAIKIVSS